MPLDLRLSEQADLDARLAQDVLQAAEDHFVRITLDDDGLGSAGAEETDLGDRQAEHSARMQRKFAQILGNHRHHAGIVRARRHLGEDDLVTLDEHFHAEDTVAAQGAGNRHGDLLRLFQGVGRHRLRLPTLTVVTAHLMMTDGIERRRTVAVTDGQERDLIIEIHESLDDDTARTGTAGGLRLMPGIVDFLLAPDHALSVSGRTHHGLHHARDADLSDSGVKFLPCIGELVTRRREPQLLCSQAADTLTVHGQECGLGRRDDVEAFLFQLHQGRSGNGLHLRDDVVRLFRLDDFAQFLTVEHVDDMAAMGDLHGRRIRITVHRNDLHAETLEFNDDFLTQFS